MTTLSLNDLSVLIKDKKISTNNVNLIFGSTVNFISEYLKQKLGYNGFVLGIIGRISNETVSTLLNFDPKLKDEKVVLEIKIRDDDALYMDINSLLEIADYIDLGLSDEDIIEQIDTAISNGSAASSSLVCIPYINCNDAERVTSLSKEIQIDDIAFVKIN